MPISLFYPLRTLFPSRFPTAMVNPGLVDGIHRAPSRFPTAMVNPGLVDGIHRAPSRFPTAMVNPGLVDGIQRACGGRRRGHLWELLFAAGRGSSCLVRW